MPSTARTTRTTSLLVTAVLAGSLAAVPAPAAAGHTPLPGRVQLMGSLMSELSGGACGDWDGSDVCAASGAMDMRPVAPGSTTYALTATVPAGSYAWKVRLNGSWDENYGAGGASGGPDLPLSLQAPAELRFTYDHATHEVAVRTTSPQAEGLVPEDAALASSSLRRDLTREQFYFVMADRFENGDPTNDTGGVDRDTNGDGVVDRDDHGLDPTDKGMYHGGDLRGLLDRLDHVQGLGTTAIWLTPSFKNEPTQEVAPGEYDAGYHGYWVTDFTQIDPHLGTNEDLEALVQAAHARGIKVFFDIITNHTADVLGYQEGACDGTQVPYVSKDAAPYRDAQGRPFDDRAFAAGDDFPEVDAATSFPYVPTFATEDDRALKVPAWLNDPTMYHNRGTSTFAGEDAEYGDFPSGRCSGLDDLWTERPEVVRGMIDIYETWVRDAGIDGFRIDTVKHVGMDFWKRFGPALQGYAASIGNDDFFMFGEVYDADPRFMSRYTTEGRLQATVDFGFQGTGVGFAKGRPTTEVRDFYALDDWFTDADSNAYSLPTFLGNHDMGRVGTFLRDSGFRGEELLARDQLAHSLMYLTRGQPVVYYGDEQGFVGDGGDQDARESMFPSVVDSYNDNDLIGTDATTADANFDPQHPLYRHIAGLAQLRKDHPALADGAQVHRYASSGPGVYAFSRIDAQDRVEHVVALNNATTAKTVTLPTDSRSTMFGQLWPASKARVLSDDEGRITVTVPPLSALVWRAHAPLVPDPAPTAFFTSPLAGGTVGGRTEVGVTVPEGGFSQVSFLYRPVGTTQWRPLGTDDNAPYRVFHDVSGLPAGTYLEYRAVVRDADGDLAAAASEAFTGAAAPPAGSGGAGALQDVEQPGAVSVPGSHGSEMGCPAVLVAAGGDWEPGCDAAQLALRPDGIWSRTYDLPAGTYEYKAALDRTWDVNYGAGAQQNGSNIPYTHGGGAVSFFYDHRTNWVTSTAQGPVWAAVGSFQSELGCPTGDWQPSCLKGLLQDPDGDGVFVFRTRTIPAGTYAAKAVRDQGWAGAVPADDVTFAVAEGDVVRFTLVPETGSFGVTTEDPPVEPDLASQRARWVVPDRIETDVPDGDRRGWGYRLHFGPEGSLSLDSETVGGSSVPLSLEPGDPDVLRLRQRDARSASAIASSDELAVVVYDARGRLLDATGVVVGTWRATGRPAPPAPPQEHGVGPGTGRRSGR